MTCCQHGDTSSIDSGKEPTSDCPLTRDSDMSTFSTSIFEGPRMRAEIEFKDISYSIKTGRNEYKTLVNNVSGKFESGKLTAVLGPSGAGKSTLLNILAGYRTKYAEGKVLVNGSDRDLRRFRKISCYIMQDDILLPNLSVMESMMVSANLHLREGMTTHQKQMVVEEILSMLGLLSAADTSLNDISGGQRKRLAIALELVNNPPVIFLDEPTSGLDSFSAFHCISLMKQLARGGRTVVCTIHQPSAKLFELFDTLYLLSAGQCIYSGGLNQLLPYLETQELVCPKYHNPADFIIEVASGEYGDVINGLVKAWKIQEKRVELESLVKENLTQKCSTKGCNSDAMIVPAIPNCTFKTSTDSLLHCASQTTQFAVLMKRSMVSIFRDRMFTHLRLVSVIAVAILIGLLYFGIGDDGNKVFNNTGCLFFSMLFLMFVALMPTVLTFPLEKVVFIREHLNNWYSLKSYYLAKTMADLPFQILLPLIYCSIVYFMTDQPRDVNRYMQYCTVTIMTCLVAQSIGLLLGAVAPSVPTAVFVAPVTGIPVLLFSGFFVNFDTIPKYMQWLTYISFARYSWEGMIVAIYGNNRGNLTCDGVGRCIFETSHQVLDAMDVEESALYMDYVKFYFDIFILGCFFVTLRLITYMVLRYKVKSQSS